jgi:plasmid maintenance system antidote protein VapI
MLMTKRKPATVGEILVEEFMRPMQLTQAALAEAMGSSASTSTSCAMAVGT